MQKDRVICPCLGVTERQIYDEIRAGAHTIDELKLKLKVATKCTGCEAYLFDALGEDPTQVTGPPTPFSLKFQIKNIPRRVYRFFRPAWLYMATFFIENESLHTRINMANLEFPENPGSGSSVWIKLHVFNPEGIFLCESKHKVLTNETKFIEMADILRSCPSAPPFGLVKIFLKSNSLGSRRVYCHWYNDQSITSTHEKATDRPFESGHQTLSKVIVSPQYETHISITNLSTQKKSTNLVLSNHQGKKIDYQLTLPPWGTLFSSISDLYPHAGNHLDKKMGDLYLENGSLPTMFYYFGLNKEYQTWQVQHL